MAMYIRTIIVWLALQFTITLNTRLFQTRLKYQQMVNLSPPPADLSDMSRTALPAALELIEQMAEALGIALRALDAETRHGRTLSGHNAIAAYEAFKLNVGGE